MFDIYDHRIKYAPELNGGANTSYCSVGEHIITFFIDQYPRRKKAEEKIVDLLINLRYYYDTWNRAKLFALNCELVHLPQNSNINRLKERSKHHETNSSDDDTYGDPKVFEQPHGYMLDSDVNENDLYTQEFFLHAYSLLSKDRENFLEADEGQTYIRTKHQDRCSRKIFPLIKGPCGDQQKWNLKIRRLIKKIPNREGREDDYLDLDLIIDMMLLEYKN